MGTAPRTPPPGGRHSFTPVWLAEHGIPDGSLDATSVAWLLSNLTLGDLRSMFFSTAEMAALFGVSIRVAHRWCEQEGVPTFQFGTGSGFWASKTVILAALRRLTQPKEDA